MQTQQSVRFGIRAKFLVISLGLIALLLLPMIAISIFASDRLSNLAEDQIDALIATDLDTISESTYHLIETHAESVTRKINDDLAVAQHLIATNGGIQICGDATINWQATNQLSRESQLVNLPQLCVGEMWLGQNASFEVTTPIIDELESLVGGTMTIFQVMNREGDLLRVATNVPRSETERAIGTYIPAVNPDGTTNPVVTTIMNGETYRGLAYVWDAMYVTAYTPVYDAAGNIIAVIYVGEKQDEFGLLFQTLQDITIGDSGYVFVLDATGSDRGTYIISGDGTRDGESIWDTINSEGRYVGRELITTAMRLDQGELSTIRYAWQNPGEAEEIVESRLAYYEPWGWVIGFHANESDYTAFFNEVAQSRTSAVGMTIAVGALFAVIGGAMVWMFANVISRPLKQITDVALSLTAGDLSQRVNVRSNDETGVLAESFNQMADNLETMIESERANAQAMADTITRYVAFVGQVADGNLSVRVNTGRVQHADLERLGNNLNDMVERLAEMAGQVRSASSLVQMRSSEIQQAATVQATSSTEQDAVITQTLGMVEELTHSIGETAASVQSVADAARQSMTVSHKGSVAVERALHGMGAIVENANTIVETITALSERTRQIEDIIDSVTELAEQSKLLALNASIEAARAGEQGTGFAVVSMEVRQLAEQSQKATESIAQILNEIKARTDTAVKVSKDGRVSAETGSDLVSAAGDVIRELTSVIEYAAQEMEQITHSTQQQSGNMQELASAMTAIKETSTQTAVSTQQTDRSAQDLNKTAHEMQSAADRYSF